MTESSRTETPNNPSEPVRTDAALLEAICSGDMLALEALFGRYKQSLYQTALGITRDAQTAEEVIQDCLYRLYRNAERLDGTLPLAPWLYRVTVNLCYSRLKTRRRHWTEPFHQLAERLWANHHSAPEHIAEQHEMQGVVRATLERLSPQHRAVLVLHYFHDYAIAEIAEILECPEGTIKSRLYYARKVLKEQLRSSVDDGDQLLPDFI